MTLFSRRPLQRALSAVSIAAAAALAVGCSSATAPAASSGGTASFKGVSLTVWSGLYYDPFKTDNAKDLQACASQLGIKVSVQTFTTDYVTKVLEAASSHTLPDVLLLDSDVEFPQFAAQNVLTPLSKLGLSTAGQSKAVAVLGQYKGTQYGLPSNVEDYALFYDKSAFASAGISGPPQTFAQLVSDAKKLTSGKKEGIALAGDSDGAAPLFFLPFLLSSGGNPGDLTGSGAVAAVGLYKQLAADGSLSKEFVNWGWDAPDQFASKAAMTVTGPWEVVDPPKGVSYGVAPFPTQSAGQKPAVGLLGYDYTFPVSSNATKQAAAAALIKCRLSESNELALATGGGYIPALTSAQQDFVHKDPAVASFVNAVPTAYNYASLGTKWNSLQLQYVAALQYAAVDGDSPLAALQKAGKTGS